MKLLRDFKHISKSDVSLAGGKGASLGEMTRAGIPVPPGFIILSTAFERFLEQTDLSVEIDSILHSVNHKEIHTIDDASEKIKALMLLAEIPQDIATEIQKCFKKLNAKYVAVRSSATAEDSASAAWAGQLESYLNTTEETLLENVKKCWASLFAPRAIFYRFEKDLHKRKISVAVVVQRMVGSEKSGVAFSVHPVTQDRDRLIIEAGFGLGEAIVSGQITPDSYVVEKQPRRIIDKNVRTQSKGLYRAKNGGNEWRDIPKEKGEQQVLSDKEILELSGLISKIENHYGFPCDIEWAFEKGKFYIVQSRPITTLGKQASTDTIRFYKQEGKLGMYQLSLPALTIGRPMLRYLPVCYGDVWIFWKNEHATILIQEKRMEEIAYAFFKKAAKGFPPDWQKKWHTIDRELQRLARNISQMRLTELSNKELQEIYFDAFRLDQKMWAISIFIDALDARYDQKEINEIAERHRLDVDEIHILLTPEGQSYMNDQGNLLYEAKIGLKNPRDLLPNFFWYGTDYYTFREITETDILSAAKKAEKFAFESPKNRQQEVLKKHRLKVNPLETFKTLAQWRDDRKRLNYIGLYGLARIMNEIFSRQGLPIKFISHILPHEVEMSFSEPIPQNTLERRMRGATLVRYKEDGGYETLEGEAAEEKFVELQRSLPNISSTEIAGMVACKGYAIGTVRIIPNPGSLSAKKMKEGDILVTSMTRPEFVPLMKKAGAIVTDEGGISCHAAIVSRELNKPCIIGTKNATQSLKNGDEVEVDATRGIIRVLK
jgi:phosphohistidine swiveling domain-containing protein